ncbi:MAG: TldD/PmbA family protein [Desulfurococcales archaeon]|nr:TldD/PmbA family protein [Desulfurococcales archaeon]
MEAGEPQLPGWLRLEEVVRLAERLGASEAEAYAVASREAQVDMRSSRVERSTVSTTLTLGVRVAVKGAVAGAGGRVSGPGQVEEIVRAAVAAARRVQPDPSWPGFNPRVSAAPGGVEGAYHPETAEAGPGELAPILAAAASAAASRGASISEASAAAGWEARAYANSYGGPVGEASTYYVFYVEAVRGEGTYYDYLDSTRLEPRASEELAALAAARAVEASQARGLDGAFRGQVILEPGQAGEMLSTLLEPALSAEAVIEGRSPLAGRLGEQVLSPSLTLADDPHRPWRPASSRFDAEGHPTAAKALVASGRLEAYLHTHYTLSRHPHGGPAGNASRRSPWARPAPGASSLVLRPAKLHASLDDLVARVERGVVATANIGMWMSRPESGRLTATVTHGYLVERGSIVGPVKGVSLMADVYHLLGPGYLGAAGPLECRGSTCAPALLVDGATLA